MTIHAFNTKTLAPSEYTGLLFSRIFSHNGRLFGIATDGLYEVTGSDAELTPSFTTGKMVLGDERPKRNERMYIVGTAPNGATISVTGAFRANDEDETRATSISASDTLRKSRVKLWKDSRSRAFKYVVTGFSEVTHAEMLVEPITRRI